MYPISLSYPTDVQFLEVHMVLIYTEMLRQQKRTQRLPLASLKVRGRGVGG